MPVLRSCLLWLLVYLALAGGVAFAVERRVEHRKAALIAGGVAGLILALGITHLLNAAKKGRELLLIRRGQREVEPADGRTIAAIGTVSATGGHRLISPLTRTPCVAYAYSIIRSPQQKWEGEALVSCSIRSGIHSIRLLSLEKIAFKPETLQGESIVQNAADHLRKCDFQNVGRGDGTMRRDRGPRVEDPILRHAFFAEQVVRQGDSVCAIGKYDAGRSGIQVEKLEKGDGLLFPRLRAIGGGLMNFAGFTAVVVAAFAVFFAIVPLDERQPSPFEMRIEDLLDARIRQPVMRSGLLPVPLEPFAAELEPGEARGLFRTARGETIVKNAEAWRRDRDIDISLFKDSSRDPVAIITLTEAGELRSVVVGGEPFPAPAESFVFRRISGETIAGRLTWAKGNLPAAHVVFHTTISQVN